MKPESVDELIYEVAQNLVATNDTRMAELVVIDYVYNGRLTGKNSKKMMSIIDKHTRKMGNFEIVSIMRWAKPCDLLQKYLYTYALMDIFILERYQMNPVDAIDTYDRMKFNNVIINESNGRKSIYLYDSVAMSYDKYRPRKHTHAYGVDIYHDDDLNIVDINNIKEYTDLPEQHKRKKSDIILRISLEHDKSEYEGTLRDYIKEFGEYLSDIIFKTKYREKYNNSYMLENLLKTEYCGSTRYLYLDTYFPRCSHSHDDTFTKILAGPVELIDIPELGPTMVSKDILDVVNSKLDNL